MICKSINYLFIDILSCVQIFWGIVLFSCCFSIQKFPAKTKPTIWFSFLSETHRISRTAGSTVTLNCSNDSISNLTQLAWKMNGDNLFIIRSDVTSNSSCVSLKNSSKVPEASCARYPTAENLKLNVSMLKNQLYALTITRAQSSHTGNYTCEFTASKGVGEQKWELVITGELLISKFSGHIKTQAFLTHLK